MDVHTKILVSKCGAPIRVREPHFESKVVRLRTGLADRSATESSVMTVNRGKLGWARIPDGPTWLADEP